MRLNIEFGSDWPVTDESCLSATGKTLELWSNELGAQTFKNRREGVVWLWDQVGRDPKGAWWGITIWVEHERRISKFAKDGRIEGYGICCTKSIKAPAAKVQELLLPYFETADNVRVREGKDIKAKWITPGVDGKTDVDATFTEKDGKTAVMVNHNRIQTREESDGLRRAWGAALDSIKKSLEA